MATGAQQAGHWRDSVSDGEPDPIDLDLPDEERERPSGWGFEQIADEPPRSPSLLRETLPAAALGAAALGWTLLSGWMLLTLSPVPVGPVELIAWIGTISGPLGLIAILYLLVQRTSRREARRFAVTARAMAAQADYLERVLAGVSAHLEDQQSRLAAHGEHLAVQGDQIAGRMAEIGAAIRDDSNLLSQSSARLTSAASAARGDMGALMAALPRAEAQTREMTALLQDASRNAQDQAVTLAGQLSALAEHGRDADQVVKQAATELAGHLERIEQAESAAGQRMREAGAEMARIVEAALEQAAQAVEETRRGVDAQRGAIAAMIDQGQAAIDRAGSDAARSLGNRIEELGGKIETLAARLAAQDAASHTLIGNLDKALAGIEQRFTALADTGTERTADLAEAIVALSGHVDEMRATIAGSGDAADGLLQRTTLLRGSLDASIGQLADALPSALEKIESTADRARASVTSLLPEAEKAEAAARAAADLLGGGDELIARRRTAIEGLGRSTEQRIAAIRDAAETLHALIVDADEKSRRLADQSAPRLETALGQVREAAARAAEDAERSLAAIIPQAADRLGDASGAAIEKALADQVDRRMTDIAAVAERAIDAAATASGRLADEMRTIAQTSSEVEERIAQAKAEAAASDEATFSRRVSLLIESLNSAAIDVTKILSNDVTDTAWAAYLRGDRGVFTRRAVRLIESGEAREIARHYETEPEFREHVNRYIHDFEAMLRRILNGRESAPLGVTMLSSDMGKLYVALAQAIERLRN